MLTTLKTTFKNAVRHCDPLEVEQAIIRIVVGLVILGLIVFSYLNNSLSHQEHVAFQIDFVFEVLSIVLFVSIIKNKFNPILRRLAGAWLDIGAASLFMALTNDIGVMLVAVYLWVIFGNGFRYGKKYLYHSQLLSIVGFLIATNISPYWKIHQTIGYSLIVMLIALPLYVSKLIGRMHEATEKAEIARKKAAEASLAKTQFVANMSHEIRTPLNGIIGISTLLKTTPLNLDQQDLLKTLEGSSKLLLSLLNNVLDFTKIEERKFTVENIDFSAVEAVNDTLEIFRSQSAAKGIQIGVSVTDSLPTVKGDAFVIRQVLANLMGNAIKFTEKGSVTLSAITLQESEKKVTIRFEVADTGVGIPLDKQAKVFESFTQADSSTTRKFGGSGLGLTIAKHMIEAMGGNLQFQSTEHVGSRFWFDLSLEKSQSVVAEAISETIATDSMLDVSTQQSGNEHAGAKISPIFEKFASNKPLSILVCEDEATNQKIIMRLLTLPGHHVEIAENSDQMLDALESKTFDLVITDLNMAGMNGADALKLYRFTNPTDKDTRFILFTADATSSAREIADEAGFDAFLTKPIEAATLFNTIEKIMNLPANTANAWMKNALDKTVKVESDLKADNPALDLSTLKELESIGAGDDLFMHRLLRNYLSDSLKLIYKIETAAKQRRFGELHDYCHALKGNSLSVGAIQLATTTESIGKLSNSFTPVQSHELIATLNTDFSNLTLAVEDYLRRPVNSSEALF